jgi:hypothetical protein
MTLTRCEGFVGLAEAAVKLVASAGREQLGGVSELSPSGLLHLLEVISHPHEQTPNSARPSTGG